jgi:hypothetical protein
MIQLITALLHCFYFVLCKQEPGYLKMKGL